MRDCPYKQDCNSLSLCNFIFHNGKRLNCLMFLIPAEYIRQEMFHHFSEMSNDAFRIIQWYNKSFLFFIEGIYFDKQVPIIELAMNCFHSVSTSLVLREDINRDIAKALKSCRKQNNPTIGFISFLNTHGFDLHEYNIVFDFCGCKLLAEIRDKSVKNNPNGFHANDSYYYHRNKHKDTITLESDYSQVLERPECMLRVNWKLRDNNTKCLLETSDLLFTLDEFIQQKFRLLKDVFDNWLPNDGIILNNSSVINISSTA